MQFPYISFIRTIRRELSVIRYILCDHTAEGDGRPWYRADDAEASTCSFWEQVGCSQVNAKCSVANGDTSHFDVKVSRPLRVCDGSVPCNTHMHIGAGSWAASQMSRWFPTYPAVRRRYQVCTCATFSPDIVYECSSQGHEDIHVRPACFNVSSDVHKDRCSRIEMQLGSLGVHEQNGGDYGGRRYCTAPCRSRLELELTGASMHRGRLATMMTKLPPWRRQANRHRPEPNERCWPKRLCGPTATGE